MKQNIITTIKLTKMTKERLDNFKEFSAESYEEIIKKMLYVLNAVRKNPEFANKVLANIDKNIKRKKAMNKQA